MKTVSEAVGNRRLLKLAAFLWKLPRKRFDYSVFVGGDWQGAQDLSCGTTACALGWACTMPAFRRLGLRLGDFYPSLRSDPILNPYEVAAELFGLDPYEAEELFAPQTDREILATPKYVARKIERFVAKRREAA